MLAYSSKRGPKQLLSRLLSSPCCCALYRDHDIEGREDISSTADSGPPTEDFALEEEARKMGF